MYSTGAPVRLNARYRVRRSAGRYLCTRRGEAGPPAVSAGGRRRWLNRSQGLLLMAVAKPANPGF